MWSNIKWRWFFSVNTVLFFSFTDQPTSLTCASSSPLWHLAPLVSPSLHVVSYFLHTALRPLCAAVARMGDTALTEVYNTAVDALHCFRDAHLHIVVYRQSVSPWCAAVSPASSLHVVWWCRVWGSGSGTGRFRVRSYWCVYFWPEAKGRREVYHLEDFFPVMLAFCVHVWLRVVVFTHQPLWCHWSAPLCWAVNLSIVSLSFFFLVWQWQENINEPSPLFPGTVKDGDSTVTPKTWPLTFNKQLSKQSIATDKHIFVPGAETFKHTHSGSDDSLHIWRSQRSGGFPIHPCEGEKKGCWLTAWFHNPRSSFSFSCMKVVHPTSWTGPVPPLTMWSKCTIMLGRVARAAHENCLQYNRACFSQRLELKPVGSVVTRDALV